MKPILAAAGGAALVATLALAAFAQSKRPIPPDGTPPASTASGLVYSVLREGAPGAPRPELHDEVRVHYTGWLTDGTVFDSSRSRGPATFRLGKVIEGWNEGLQLMTVGSSYKLTIPPELGYGANGTQNIPPNATLIFEVELLDVIPLAEKPPPFQRPDAEKGKRLESGVLVEFLADGEGEPPTFDEVWVVDYAFWDEDGKLLETSALANGPLKGRAGQVTMPMLAEVPLLMPPGAIVLVEVPPHKAQPGQRLPAWMEHTTIWRLEMVRVLRPLPLPAPDAGEVLRVEQLDGGLVMEVLTEGTGETPSATDAVEVHYAGWLAKDLSKSFDSSYSRGEPSQFQVGGVIRGWTQGLLHMKAGTVARLRIPSELGYGRRGNPPTIPPSADLVFHVELLRVIHPPR